MGSPVFKDAKGNVQFKSVAMETASASVSVTAPSFIGSLAGSPVLPSYTVAQLASSFLPAANAGKLVHCSDGAAGDPCLAYSNGTSWLRILIGAAVAAS